MRNGGGVYQDAQQGKCQVDKGSVSSNHIVRGGEINTWTARRGGKWSKESV